MLNSAVVASVRRSDLDTFNQQVLACQDQAFTLAAYLLGDDRIADEVVQRAVLQTYRQARMSAGMAVRDSILRHVLRLCDLQNARPKALPAGLARLPDRERRSLLLVDVLRLSYAEAAGVLGCSSASLAQWIADARQRLVPYMATPSGEVAGA